MSVESLKSVFDLAAVVLLFLTFAAGAGVLITGNIINRRQEEKLHKFDSDLTVAKSDLAKQQERAAQAEGNIALAEQHSAEANTKAEGFRLDIAKANESAKEAEARAAEAKLELARFRAPRTLNPSQRSEIATRLRSFGANRVDIIVIGDAQEIANLAGNVVSSLREAGWSANVVGKAISGPNVSGVLVGTHTRSDSNIIAAAAALISAFQSEGIASGGFAQFGDELPMAIMGTWNTKNVAPIRILVSAKP